MDQMVVKIDEKLSLLTFADALFKDIYRELE